MVMGWSGAQPVHNDKLVLIEEQTYMTLAFDMQTRLQLGANSCQH